MRFSGSEEDGFEMGKGSVLISFRSCEEGGAGLREVTRKPGGIGLTFAKGCLKSSPNETVHPDSGKHCQV